MPDQAAESALSPYRALDLTDEKGVLCGKILADLGADVIKVEKPGGDPARNIGPFYKDIPHPEKSLFWFAYNANKRGITLDIETADGREIFKRLVKTADFVIESFDPGYLDSLGLGYSALSQVNPRIILTSITPFGQTGPKAGYKACDLTTWASGNVLYIAGDPDRPPNWISSPQAFLHAGAEAATASMVAHWHRELTGEGQHVDVSAQQCAIWATMNTTTTWDLSHFDYARSGIYLVDTYRGVKRRLFFPCQDGWIAIYLLGGGAILFVNSTKALVQWMDEEGMAPDWLKKFDWVNDYDARKITQELVARVEEPFARFFMTKNKAEFFEQAMKRGIIVGPVNTVADLCAHPQPRARRFWTELEHPELDATLTYCGPFLKMSQSPLSMRRRAPLIGEHNEEVYKGELRLSTEELCLLKQGGVI